MVITAQDVSNWLKKEAETFKSLLPTQPTEKLDIFVAKIQSLECMSQLLEHIFLDIPQEESKKESITHKKSKVDIVNDINSEVKTPKTIIKEVSNPFKDKSSKQHRWSQSDLKSIHYCANITTPLSHRKLSYLKRVLPSEISDSSLRRKLSRMGYKVVKGLVCKS